MEVPSTVLLSCALAFIAGCSGGSGGSSEIPQLNAGELTQIANGIIITAPANGSSVTTADTTVEASTPGFANITKASLLVDGVLVSTDDNGAPWDLEWPTYYWADNNLHSVVVEVQLNTGQIARSTRLSTVRVVAGAASELTFAPEVVMLEIQDQNAFTVAFAPVTEASEYEFEVTSGVDSASTPLTAPVFDLEDLDFGTHQLRYRASAPFGGVQKTGPWSNSNTIRVLRPDLPANATSQIEPNNGAYDATLTWDLARAQDTYTVTLMQQNASQPQTFEIVNDNQLVIPGLPAGNHRWQLQRTNEFGHASFNSGVFNIEAGVFANEFGGSDREDPQRIIKSKTGGAIVLATTYSDDIATPVDASGDDWIFKVDNDGATIWSTVINKPGTYRLSNLIELEDNSVIAFGTDFDLNAATAARLDADGNILQARTYPANTNSRKYQFSSAVQTGTTVLLTLEQTGAVSCGPDCFDNYSTSIATLDVATGDLVADTPLPESGGQKIISADNLQIANNGNYIISGLQEPDPANINACAFGDNYINELDSALSIVNSSVPSGPIFCPSVFSDILNVVQRSDGQFLVADIVDAMFVSVSLHSEDLQTSTSIAEFDVAANPSGLSQDTMRPTQNGGFWGLFSKDIEPDSPMQLFEYDSNLTLPGELELPDSRATSVNQGFVILDDGAALVLLGVPGPSMDRQILVRKIALTYN